MQEPISFTPATDAAAPEGPGRETLPPFVKSGTNITETTIPLVLTVQEAALLLRFDRRTIREMVRSGELDGNQRGHAIRVSGASVVQWLRGKRRVPRSKR